MKQSFQWVLLAPSIQLQHLQYSLRQGYEDAGKRYDSYMAEPVLKKEAKKFTKNKREMSKLFNAINKELRTRQKEEKLEKCYGDRCHDRCTDSCTCGWCLMNKGFEPLI